MNRCRRSARSALILLTGVLASFANVTAVFGRADPVWVRASQIPGQEPPLAEGPVPVAPVAPYGRREADHPPTPAISVRVTVPSTATPGRELEYHLTVENVSQANANHVRVKVPVPAHVRYKTAEPVPGTPPASGELVWDLGTMRRGQRVEITFVVEVEPGTAEDILCCARVVFEHGECVRTRVAKPAIRVRTTGPERAKLYDPLAYTIEVTNTGSVAASDVVLSEELPPGLLFADSNPSTSGANPLVWKLGTVFPGQPRHVEFKVIAQQSGTHLLKASVVVAGIKTVEENLSRVLVGEAKLALVKTGPSWRSADLPATYLLTVSNSGTIPVTNVELHDGIFTTESLRSNIQFIGASDDGKLVGDDVRWLLGTLAPGSRRTVSLQLRTLQMANRAGVFENLANVKADGDIYAKAICKTDFVTPAGLTLDIEKGSDPVAVGKTTTFTFRVRQIGTTASRNVGLVISLPEQLQYVDSLGPSAGSQDGRTVSFAAIGELAAGGEAVYTVTVRADRPAEVQLRASLTAEPEPKGGKLERLESTIILPELATASPAPVLEKSGAK
jgi:uncharacterized repeat protein (TIGR01451 family)